MSKVSEYGSLKTALTAAENAWSLTTTVPHGFLRPVEEELLKTAREALVDFTDRVRHRMLETGRELEKELKGCRE